MLLLLYSAPRIIIILFFLRLIPCSAGTVYTRLYLLCCPLFREERKKYINVKFWKRPSTIQLEQLFKQNDYNNVLQLSLFVKVIIAKF